MTGVLLLLQYRFQYFSCKLFWKIFKFKIAMFYKFSRRSICVMLKRNGSALASIENSN